MPDEAFEALWNLPGGKELIGMHDLFAGSAVPFDGLRDMLRLTREQMRAAVVSSTALGLLEADEDQVIFLMFPRDSGQRARLDWCLETHTEEMGPLLERLKSQLLLRFLGLKPGGTD